jgi:hypothetical protein
VGVESPDGASEAMRRWKTRFIELRRSQAEALWRLARVAAANGRAPLALQLATEAAREDPDHAEARRVLGYDKVDGAWRSTFAKRKLQRGYQWHPKFGWLKGDQVAQYEAGLRRFGNEWIDAAEDARRRQRIEDGWRVETDHYLVTTNHSLETGVQLAVKLERFHQIWRQTFAGYSLDARQLKRLFEGRRGPRGRGQPHRIFYYRSRDQYNEALRYEQPKIAMTLGIYFDKARRGYFFAGEDQDPGTLYHEATHQLFHETRRVAKHVGGRHNFWIVEGIAAYMESLTEHDGFWTLGGHNAGRVPAARQRLLDDGFYVPLAELTRMGTEDIQHYEEINKLYSQMTGLATFLMHFEGSRYRDALMRYLVAVYRDTADPETLAMLAGESYEQLDRQYREFIEAPE